MIELVLTFTILVVVLLATFLLMHRDAELSKSTLNIQVAEMKAEHMLYKLQRELANARGASPIASLAEDLSAGEGGVIHVDSTLGFPDTGTLLLDRGTGTEERVRYAGLGLDGQSFAGLTRGEQCTQDVTHVSGSDTILWNGLAEPIEIQQDPDPATYDGRVRLGTGQTIFFRGDGSGFSFRVPTDPDQVPGTAPDYLDGDQLKWGAAVNGQPTLDGWSAVYFSPRFTYEESEHDIDVNGDGDTIDLFDVGQIRRRSWDTSDPNAPADDLGLGPTVVLQERCNWGGDLDSDGLDDPLFLWDPGTRQLHVRLFIVGITAQSVPIIRTVESTVFLRNEAEY